MESSRQYRSSAFNRAQIERRLKSSQPVGFITVAITLAVLQTVVLILSGTLPDISSRRTLRRQWNNADALQIEVTAARMLQRDTQTSRLDDDAAPSSLPDNQPIDNYYSRRHLDLVTENMPVLFVGGSDGSGTRAVVATLIQLGIPMLVDDTNGYDVHGLTLFNGEGWPPLVNAVLNATNSANYEYDSLPSTIKSFIREEMNKFRNQIALRGAAKLQSFVTAENTTTNKVRYGLKAPVSMLLLPVLRHSFGPIKFIHVVRDGRDVSFSRNQSPVKKFYNQFYPDFRSKRTLYDNKLYNEVMAMELWNDWNMQALDWERNHNDGKTFDYLIMRSEDMIDPQTRYQSLTQLADFVGSPKTPQEVCCLSRQHVSDMGVSGKHGSDPSELLVSNTMNVAEQIQEMDWRKAFRPIDQALERRKLELLKIKHVAPHLYEQLHRMQEAQDKEMKIRRQQRLLQKFDTHRRVEGILLRHEIDKPSEDSTNGAHSKSMVTASPGVMHNHSEFQESKEVKNRYGRWIDDVRGRKELKKLLHRVGKDGLSLIGYEPKALFLDESNEGVFQCDQTVVCPKN
ncbi:hypothetical protein MPSEU_000425500 [Mayamaea pseudoterrestris]|nr:hypothetical protein MPSEU_000425500 [Mayamaea pseudoterrestris]